MWLEDIKLGKGSCVAIFWERAAHSVTTRSDCFLSVCNIRYISYISLFGFEVGILALFLPIPGHCLPFTYLKTLSSAEEQYSYLSFVLRKPVFGVSDQVRHKVGCTTTQDG